MQEDPSPLEPYDSILLTLPGMALEGFLAFHSNAPPFSYATAPMPSGVLTSYSPLLTEPE